MYGENSTRKKAPRIIRSENPKKYDNNYTELFIEIDRVVRLLRHKGTPHLAHVSNILVKLKNRVQQIKWNSMFSINGISEEDVHKYRKLTEELLHISSIDIDSPESLPVLLVNRYTASWNKLHVLNAAAVENAVFINFQTLLEIVVHTFHLIQVKSPKESVSVIEGEPNDGFLNQVIGYLVSDLRQEYPNCTKLRIAIADISNEKDKNLEEVGDDEI